jgi:hypothetical protein
VFGPAFLDESNRCVEDDDQDNDDRIHRLPQDRRDAGCGKQCIDEEVVELLEETAQWTRCRTRRQAIGAMSLHPFRCFRHAQAIMTAGEPAEDYLGGQRVPDDAIG